MARTISSTLAGILAAPHRDLDWTLAVTVGVTTYRWATSEITVGGHDHANDLEFVSEIRQTLESPADTVSVALQNKDSVIGQLVQASHASWSRALAVLGRQYYEVGEDLARTGVTAWIEVFRGAVQRPEVNDLQVRFDVISDVRSAGQIVARRTLALLCPHQLGHPGTCGYTGDADMCDKHLKSRGGCDSLDNSHRFGGMEHRYNPRPVVPGTGGNQEEPPPPIGGGGGGPETPPGGVIIL